MQFEASRTVDSQKRALPAPEEFQRIIEIPPEIDVVPGNVDLTPKMWEEIQLPVADIVSRLRALRERDGVVTDENIAEYTAVIDLSPDSSISSPTSDATPQKMVMRDRIRRQLHRLGLEYYTSGGEEDNVITIRPSRDVEAEKFWF
jgi:hypothetical protein